MSVFSHTLAFAFDGVVEKCFENLSKFTMTGVVIDGYALQRREAVFVFYRKIVV